MVHKATKQRKTWATVQYASVTSVVNFLKGYIHPAGRVQI